MLEASNTPANEILIQRLVSALAFTSSTCFSTLNHLQVFEVPYDL